MDSILGESTCAYSVDTDLSWAGLFMDVLRCGGQDVSFMAILSGRHISVLLLGGSVESRDLRGA
jgi:hypothetical protein